MSRTATLQAAVGAGVLAVGLGMGWGAWSIPSDAGYSGVGPNFLPWLVSVLLVVCGAWLVYEARSGGFRQAEAPEGAGQGHWPGFVWVSAGLLLNAALITTVGFILSCSLCFALAVQGFKASEGAGRLGAKGWIASAAVGIAIAAPVYWMFTKLLAISLPGLTASGWL
ncbi:MAG: tripartite tricarboxylate transporter TctB family protein [Ideonella sp.]|nr:tripartite tricarboxylate transporter TctB family protein [Ideonella sp.]MCC7456742.1 tripartite tricarboxylate transporter TctB family protein [Nitrospira sp.]